MFRERKPQDFFDCPAAQELLSLEIKCLLKFLKIYLSLNFLKPGGKTQSVGRSLLLDHS